MKSAVTQDLNPTPRTGWKPVLQTMLAPVVLAACLAGCGGNSGPERAAVSGTVTVDGKPLAAGVVRFIPIEPTKGPAAVAFVKAGEFSLNVSQGPVPGRQRIEIEATDFQNFAIDDEKAYSQAYLQSGGRPVLQNPIPETYNRHSTLAETVSKDGPNRFDFKLQVATMASR